VRKASKGVGIGSGHRPSDTTGHADRYETTHEGRERGPCFHRTRKPSSIIPAVRTPEGSLSMRLSDISTARRAIRHSWLTRSRNFSRSRSTMSCSRGNITVYPGHCPDASSVPVGSGNYAQRRVANVDALQACSRPLVQSSASPDRSRAGERNPHVLVYRRSSATHHRTNPHIRA
jgi:hypothetical protein